MPKTTKSKSKKPAPRVAAPAPAKKAPVAARRMILRVLGMLVLAALIVSILVGWGNWLWKRVGPELAASHEYRFDPSTIQVLPTPPEWVHVNVREEVLRGASWNEPLTMLDERLPRYIADAFELHPWVAKAKVTLAYPAQVLVELEYRRPACSFKLETKAGDERLVLDAKGYRLPETNLALKEITSLPQLEPVSGVHLPFVGQKVEEPRLLGAAEIAGVLCESWPRLGLEQIVPLAVLEGSGQARYPVYELRDAAGRTILWGAAPSAAPSDELAAIEKVRRLRLVVQRWREAGEIRPGERIDLREVKD